MSPELFKKRTKAYALDVIRFTDALPPSRAANVISRRADPQSAIRNPQS